jgi:hypothetical protein
MFLRFNKPNIPNNATALPWAVVFLLLFICMSACSSLLNLVDGIKAEEREEEGPPQKLAPISPWLADTMRAAREEEATQEPVTISELPMPTIPPETVKPISFPYSQGLETRYRHRAR